MRERIGRSTRQVDPPSEGFMLRTMIPLSLACLLAPSFALAGERAADSAGADLAAGELARDSALDDATGTLLATHADHAERSSSQRSHSKGSTRGGKGSSSSKSRGSRSSGGS